MGWPFGPKPKPRFDPHAVRPAEPTFGMGGQMGEALQFLQLAGNEGAAQLAGTGQRFLPDINGSRVALGALETAARGANDALIGDRVQRSGVPLAALQTLDVQDPGVRQGSFVRGGALNPDTGGLEGWHARSGRRVARWNGEGVGAPLVNPALIGEQEIAAAQPSRRGLMFGWRR